MDSKDSEEMYEEAKSLMEAADLAKKFHETTNRLYKFMKDEAQFPGADKGCIVGAIGSVYLAIMRKWREQEPELATRVEAFTNVAAEAQYMTLNKEQGADAPVPEKKPTEEPAVTQFGLPKRGLVN